MRVRSYISPLSREGLKQIVIVALGYWFFLGLTKYTLQYAPGIEFRLAGFVPILAGMFFGLPGAIGSAIGNFLGDLGGPDIMPARLCGILANFYIAYVPYRIWYGYKKHNPAMFIYNQRSFLCFMGCLFVAEFNVSAFLCGIIDYFYNPANDFLLFTRLVSSQYSFPVLLGLPLLLYLRSRKAACFYPPPGGRKGYQKPALVLLTVYNLIYLAAICVYDDLLPSHVLCSMLLNAAVLGYICTMPVASKPGDMEMRNYLSLVARFTMALMILFTGFVVSGIVLTLVDAAFHNVNFSDVNNWQSFDTEVNAIIVLLIAMIYFMLGQIEKNVSRPLEKLSKQALNYVEKENGQGLRFDSGLPSKVLSSQRDEIAALEESFYRMGKEISESVQKLTLESEKYHAQHAQLAVASQIQHGLMPDLDLINQWLEENQHEYYIQGDMRAAKQVGGDMYDCYRLDDDHLLLSVADVSGKGVPAALFEAVTQALLENSLLGNKEAVNCLADIVTKVNNSLENQNKEMLFVTMWVGILELSTGVITYVNAGHNPALLKIREQPMAQKLEKLSGPVLGLMDNQTYISHKAVLPPGAKLLIYTDGITEAENVHNKFYGTERLCRVFSSAYTPEAVINDVASFVGSAPQSDDATFIWVERLG